AATWSSWYDVVNTCKVACTATSQTKSVACPSGQTGTHTQKRDYTCPAAKWSAWYDVTNTCKPICSPTYQIKSGVACPSDQTGIRTQRRNYTCPAATWSAWYDVVNTCQSVTPACGYVAGTTVSSLKFRSDGLCARDNSVDQFVSGVNYRYTWDCVTASGRVSCLAYRNRYGF
ncbi:MAG: hypothetical protein AB7S81_08500, partial [Bdellovibrionales bacterium]